MAQGQILKDSAVCTAQHPFFFFPGLSLKNVRKRDSKRKSWRGGEKPIMTETVRKVHRL